MYGKVKIISGKRNIFLGKGKLFRGKANMCGKRKTVSGERTNISRKRKHISGKRKQVFGKGKHISGVWTSSNHHTSSVHTPGMSVPSVCTLSTCYDTRIGTHRSAFSIDGHRAQTLVPHNVREVVVLLPFGHKLLQAIAKNVINARKKRRSTSRVASRLTSTSQESQRQNGDSLTRSMSASPSKSMRTMTPRSNENFSETPCNTGKHFLSLKCLDRQTVSLTPKSVAFLSAGISTST